MDKEYVQAVGRRKTAIAQVRLMTGTGGIVVNGLPHADFFRRLVDQQVVIKPLAVTQSQDKYAVSAKVIGGGTTGQAAAIAHGIARALVRADANTKPTLRANRLLTRDSRAKERKKVGLKRARKAPQSPKR